MGGEADLSVEAAQLWYSLVELRIQLQESLRLANSLSERDLPDLPEWSGPCGGLFKDLLVLEAQLRCANVDNSSVLGAVSVSGMRGFLEGGSVSTQDSISLRTVVNKFDEVRSRSRRKKWQADDEAESSLRVFVPSVAKLGASTEPERDDIDSLRYDDRNFYKRLVRGVVPSTAGRVMAAGRGRAVLKGRESSRIVVRKASKGRKINYSVIPKLVNFVGSQGGEIPDVSRKLFSHLWGMDSAVFVDKASGSEG